MREHQQDYWLAFWCTKNYGIKKSKNRRPSAREGDPQPLTVVAADLKAIGAPAAVALIDGNASVMSPLNAAGMAIEQQAVDLHHARPQGQPPGSSSGAGTHHRRGRWPASGDAGCRAARERPAGQRAMARPARPNREGSRQAP